MTFWRRTPKDDFPFHALARYNAERSRGIVHTPEWAERMTHDKAAFDNWAAAKIRDRMAKAGHPDLRNVWGVTVAHDINLTSTKDPPTPGGPPA